MVTITKKEHESLKAKAKEYDELIEVIEKETGNPDGDLTTIAEAVLNHLDMWPA